MTTGRRASALARSPVAALLAGSHAALGGCPALRLVRRRARRPARASPAASARRPFLSTCLCCLLAVRRGASASAPSGGAPAAAQARRSPPVLLGGGASPSRPAPADSILAKAALIAGAGSAIPVFFAIAGLMLLALSPALGGRGAASRRDEPLRRDRLAAFSLVPVLAQPVSRPRPHLRRPPPSAHGVAGGEGAPLRRRLSRRAAAAGSGRPMPTAP